MAHRCRIAASTAASGRGSPFHSLATKRKRLDDIKRELSRPFEYENRLTELLKRQRELNRLLDIDKDEAGTGAIDSEDARQAA